MVQKWNWIVVLLTKATTQALIINMWVLGITYVSIDNINHVFWPKRVTLTIRDLYDVICYKVEVLKIRMLYVQEKPVIKGGMSLCFEVNLSYYLKYWNC